MATRYARGRAAEYRTIRYLEALGYYVMRAAGSKGVFDLFAVRGEDRKLISNKLNCSETPLERETIEYFQCPGISKECWRWDTRARTPKVKVIK